MIFTLNVRNDIPTVSVWNLNYVAYFMRQKRRCLLYASGTMLLIIGVRSDVAYFIRPERRSLITMVVRNDVPYFMS